MSAYLSILLADALRYLIPASLTWFLLTQVFAGWAEKRRLGHPTAGQIRREIIYSSITIFIFALNGLGVALLTQAGIFEIYRDPSRYGLAYLGVSLVAVLLLHEFYFYAVHRLLHQPGWFERVHRLHHLSLNPTPWTAYAFHPVEAALMAIFLPFALILLPLHGSVVATFLVIMILRNVIGHCAVELATPGPVGRLYARFLTTTAHHHQHHRYASGNYGLYFRFSDQLFGTERPDYGDLIMRFSHPGNTGEASDRRQSRHQMRAQELNG